MNVSCPINRFTPMLKEQRKEVNDYVKFKSIEYERSKAAWIKSTDDYKEQQLRKQKVLQEILDLKPQLNHLYQ